MSKTSKLARASIMPSTLAELEATGYFCQKVEYWNSFAKPFGKRVDFFHCIDVIGVHPIKRETIGVQSTSRTAVSARLAKIRELLACPNTGPKLLAWFLSGNKLEVWGWDKHKNRRRLLRVLLGINEGKLIELGWVEVV